MNIFYRGFYLLVFVSLLACEQSPKHVRENFVVCTTNIIESTVRAILPQDIKVMGLMGPGVDPHLYKAGFGDLELLQNATIIVENGLHLEGKMADVLQKLSRNKPVFSLADGVNSKDLILVSENVYDPHIWFDVKLWHQGVSHLSKQLIEQLPDAREAIQLNTDKFLKDLDQLDEYVNNKVQELDKDQRVLVTAHDAFNYFGQAYGIEVKGLQGISTQSEYGIQDVSNLVNFLQERKIKAVFIETSVSDRAINAVVEGCSKKGHEINIGGELYSDALGGESDPGHDYFSMVKHNTNTIVEALK